MKRLESERKKNSINLSVKKHLAPEQRGRTFTESRRLESKNNNHCTSLLLAPVRRARRSKDPQADRLINRSPLPYLSEGAHFVRTRSVHAVRGSHTWQQQTAHTLLSPTPSMQLVPDTASILYISHPTTLNGGAKKTQLILFISRWAPKN